MERRSQGARDRRAPAGEAGDASRRKVIAELGRTAQLCDAADAGRIAAPIARRLMRVHFGDRTAEMHHEHDDTPDVFVTSHDPSFCTEAEYALAVDPKMRFLGSSRGRRNGDNDTSERQPSVWVVDYQITYRITPRVPNSLPFWAFPSTKILLVCDSPPGDFTEVLFEYGCRGMISRDALDRDLLKAVRAVAAGELWIGRRRLARLLEGASERRRETTIPFVTSPHDALTLRENSIASTRYGV